MHKIGKTVVATLAALILAATGVAFATSASGDTNALSLPRATGWTQASATVTAPAGATHLRWTYTWAAPAAGPAFLLDDESITTH